MAEEVRKPRKIHPSRFGAADGKRIVWATMVEADTPFEDLLEPSYWAHVAEANLRPIARIEVYPDEGHYFAELIVRTSGRLAASVSVLRKVDLEPLEAAPASDFTVKWQGPHHKHAVVRLKDKQVIQHGFDTKESALGWLATNVKSLAA